MELPPRRFARFGAWAIISDNDHRESPRRRITGATA
jgi:hypothetical protein